MGGWLGQAMRAREPGVWRALAEDWCPEEKLSVDEIVPILLSGVIAPAPRER